MKTLVSTLLLTVSLVCLLSYASHAQQAEAPVYKDGDWWKVKVETVFQRGVSRTGRCDEAYPEYLVKMEKGKPKVLSVSGNKEEEINCPTIANELLNLGEEAGRYLKFPLAVNNSWTFQVTAQGLRGLLRFTENFKVVAREKVQSSKGELDAFRIEASNSLRVESLVDTTYHYAPKSKSIVLFKLSTPSVDRKVTLLDYNISE